MSLTLIVGTKIIGLAWGKSSLAVLTLVFRQFVVRLLFTLVTIDCGRLRVAPELPVRNCPCGLVALLCIFAHGIFALGSIPDPA